MESTGTNQQTESQRSKRSNLLRSFYAKFSGVSEKLDLVFSFGEEIPRGQGLLTSILILLSTLILSYLLYRNGSVSVTMGDIVKVATPLLLLAWAAGLVLAAGKVDISLGGVATLGGVVFAWISYSSPIWGVIVAIVVGLAVGAFNGWLVARRSAPPLLVTWAAGIITASLAGVFAFLAFNSTKFGSTSSVSLPWAMPSKPFLLDGAYFIPFLAIAITAGTCLLVFRLGALARVVGANALSASYSGFRVERVVLRIYSIAGMGAALAGCLSAVAVGSANSTGLVGKEMIAIAIAVLGGTVMSGGYFSAVGIMVAVIFWTLLFNMINGENFLGLGLQEGRFSAILVAIIVITASALLGRRMSGETRTIQVDNPVHRMKD